MWLGTSPCFWSSDKSLLDYCTSVFGLGMPQALEQAMEALQVHGLIEGDAHIYKSYIGYRNLPQNFTYTLFVKFSLYFATLNMPYFMMDLQLVSLSFVNNCIFSLFVLILIYDYWGETMDSFIANKIYRSCTKTRHSYLVSLPSLVFF